MVSVLGIHHVFAGNSHSKLLAILLSVHNEVRSMPLRLQKHRSPPDCLTRVFLKVARMKFPIGFKAFLFALLTFEFSGSILMAQNKEDLRQVFEDIGKQIAGAVQGEGGGDAFQDLNVGQQVATDEEVVELPRAKVEVKPNEIRLHLNDGSVVTGELTLAELQVTTEFGPLTVPISRIQSVRPGLESYPELSEKLSQLVQQLGDENYENREQAEKALLGYGLAIKNFIASLDEASDSELKRRLGTIKKALAELEDLDEEESEDPAWIEGDTIVTDHFTIVGKIQSDEFSLASKYGDLTIKLSDVKFGTRQWGTREPVSRTLSVNAQNFVQRDPESTKIRVQRGDRVGIKVEGTLYLSPWDETASPEGLPEYGTYMGKYPIGAVLVRFGKGEWQMVGREKSLTANRDGTIEFAVAMMDNFIQNGYEFPGEYKIKLRVEPR